MVVSCPENPSVVLSLDPRLTAYGHVGLNRLTSRAKLEVVVMKVPRIATMPAITLLAAHEETLAGQESSWRTRWKRSAWKRASSGPKTEARPSRTDRRFSRNDHQSVTMPIRHSELIAPVTPRTAHRHSSGWHARSGTLVLCLLALASQAFAPAHANGQQLTQDQLAWLRSHALDPSIAGGWARRAAEVQRRRESRWRMGRLQGLAPAQAAAEGAALTGDLYVPVLAVIYPDVPEPYPTADLQEAVFGTMTNTIVTVSEYYSEVSHGLLSVSGEVTDWIVLDSAASYYLHPDEYGWAKRGRYGEWLNSIFKNADPIVDFGRFDNDGPDNVPNSGDDDGEVDLLVILYATDCTGDWRAGYIWPGGGRTSRVTNDPSANGGYIRVGPFAYMNAQRRSVCEPVYAGVLAHEIGHAFGLPDLYDYTNMSNGIGYWGLMAYGLYNEDYSPAYLCAWSRDRLGWVTVLAAPDSETVVLEPTEQFHTVYRYDPPGTQEYFLLENRQRFGTDEYLRGDGLLIWHFDPGGSNNNELRKRVDLEEADGLADLDDRRNQGDEGDPFPGSTANRQFGASTNPSSDLNDGETSGLLVRKIAEVEDRSIAATFGFESFLLSVTATGGGRIISDPEGIDCPEDCSESFVEETEVTLSATSDSAWVFSGWSGACSGKDPCMLTLSSDTSVSATFVRTYSLTVSVAGMGTVTSDPLGINCPEDCSESYLTGTEVTLTAAPDSAWTFSAWDGACTGTDPCTLRIADDASVSGTFVPSHAVAVSIDGNGRVTSEPAGIDCPADCSEEFASGSAVTLTAVADSAWMFSAWGGACTGFDSCLLSVSEDQSVSAVFTKPVFAVNDVLDHLLQISTTLSPNEVRYLDDLGNRNGRLDVGDFRAWLVATGRLDSAITLDRTPRNLENPGRTRR